MPADILSQIKTELQQHATQERKTALQRFFKTGKGQYGEGDIFIGLDVPTQRKIAKKYYKETTLKDIESLLHEAIHEYRLSALYILTLRYEKIKGERPDIVALYLRNTKYVNNWDLVDTSAPRILGTYLLEKGDTSVLYTFAKSKNLWEQRIAIMSTLAFIKAGKYEDTLKIAEILLPHKQDLIHKAVGWMLREVGNMDMNMEVNFLRQHYKEMPRTMLRYAIEKFDKKLREDFMKGAV